MRERHSRGGGSCGTTNLAHLSAPRIVRYPITEGPGDIVGAVFVSIRFGSCALGLRSPVPDHDSELLTADELAGRLKLQPTTVRRWSRLRRIPSIKITRKVVRYDWCAVVAALKDLPPCNS